MFRRHDVRSPHGQRTDTQTGRDGLAADGLRVADAADGAGGAYETPERSRRQAVELGDQLGAAGVDPSLVADGGAATQTVRATGEIRKDLVEVRYIGRGEEPLTAIAQ